MQTKKHYKKTPYNSNTNYPITEYFNFDDLIWRVSASVWVLYEQCDVVYNQDFSMNLCSFNLTIITWIKRWFLYYLPAPTSTSNKYKINKYKCRTELSWTELNIKWNACTILKSPDMNILILLVRALMPHMFVSELIETPTTL